MKPNGNLALYANTDKIWDTNTRRNPGERAWLHMKTNGHLVLHSTSDLIPNWDDNHNQIPGIYKLWERGTNGYESVLVEGMDLTLQIDGKLSLTTTTTEFVVYNPPADYTGC